MDPQKAQKLYQQVDQAVELLQKNLNSNYLDALTETLNNLHQHQVNVENGAPTPDVVAQLTKLYQTIDLTTLVAPDLFALIQLLLVRWQKVDRPQANLQATPSAIGLLFSLLVNTFERSVEKALTIVDPVVGSGNLLFAIAQQLAFEQRSLNLYGVDNNDDLLGLAAVLSQLLHQDVTYLHQDALTPWLLDQQPDVVVADLPVGYYPVDSRSEQFDLRAKSGHSFAHFLLLEQSMKLLKDGGLGLFIVPANLFQQNNGTDLTRWLTSKVYLQALLSLPSTVFQDELPDKAILVLQSHGGNAQQAKQVLIANTPDTKSIKTLQEFSAQLQTWAQANLH